MNEISAKQLVIAAGPVMIPIVLASITAMTIIINRWRYFHTIKIDVDRLKSEVFALIRENKIKSAIAVCERRFSPTSAVLKAGLLKFGCLREEIKDSTQTAIDLQMPQLEQGLIGLITIANVTPLFGVLGTVLGITMIFQTIQTQTAGMYTITPADLSGGIWQALLTTLAGLVVAIPTFVAYNYFIGCVNSTLYELYTVSNQLVNLLTSVHETTNSQIAETLE